MTLREFDQVSTPVEDTRLFSNAATTKKKKTGLMPGLLW